MDHLNYWASTSAEYNQINEKHHTGLVYLSQPYCVKVLIAALLLLFSTLQCQQDQPFSLSPCIAVTVPRMVSVSGLRPFNAAPQKNDMLLAFQPWSVQMSLPSYHASACQRLWMILLVSCTSSYMNFLLLSCCMDNIACMASCSTAGQFSCRYNPTSSCLDWHAYSSSYPRQSRSTLCFACELHALAAAILSRAGRHYALHANCA